MLTYYQVQTGAYVDENGSLYCSDCFESGDKYCAPISNYGLDEWQSESNSGEWCAVAGFVEDWSEGWECQGCEIAVVCDDCGCELREGFDADCEDWNATRAEADEDAALD